MPFGIGLARTLDNTHIQQQNGVAERLNRTLIEGVCTVLADSKLPHRVMNDSLPELTQMESFMSTCMATVTSSQIRYM